jgi:hypothetical protein
MAVLAHGRSPLLVTHFEVPTRQELISVARTRRQSSKQHRPQAAAAAAIIEARGTMEEKRA